MTIFQTLTTSMPSPIPDSELARARQYMQHCQKTLAFHRGYLWTLNADHLAVTIAERNLLAALSWVWDAQQRAEAEAARPFYEYIDGVHTKVFDEFMVRMNRVLAQSAKRNSARAKAA